VHVAERLRAQHDGPMLEALKRLQSTTIHLPARERDRPDRDRLAERFEAFRAAA
jgi:putative restriction endonuclease